jgi:serine protease Do
MVRRVRGLCAVSLFVVNVILCHPSSGWGGAENSPFDLRTAISQVANMTVPAVVHIEATRGESVLLPSGPFDQEPLVRYSFALPENPNATGNARGTGMVIDQKGNILTSYHVVCGAQEIVVFLDSGRKLPATAVGCDPKTDLAVIRVSSEDSLPCVTFGDSDRLEMGEWVVAIGFPRDQDPVVSQGIVRARHRRGVTDPTTLKDLLQTDAAINNGYCGGPLLNLRGEVIGVSSAIISEAPDFKGIGFAMPSNAAIYVARKLIAHGRVERGWLKPKPARQGRWFQM